MTTDDEPPREALPADSDDPPELADTSFVPAGNPLRLRGLLPLLFGLLPVVFLLIVDRRFSFGLPLGALGVAVATFGVLDLLGTFDDPEEALHSVSLRELALPLAALSGSIAVLVLVLRLAVAGTLPRPIFSAGLLVTGSCLAVLGALALLLHRLGVIVRGRAPGAPGGHTPPALGAFPAAFPAGAVLLALAILLYVPMLGSYSLFDPWETHYGEVSREMLARGDWISFWWAQEGWFFSKPALNFWLQGLSFLLLGVEFAPDRMLASVADGSFPQPEWAVRLPVVAFASVALYFVYKAVANVFGTRAGFLGALVLMTAPYWFFLAHQSMTDMPYVAPLTAAVALIALGLSSDPSAMVSRYAIRAGSVTLKISAVHLLLGAVIATVLPQLVYLVSLNFSLFIDAADRGFQVHPDLFFAGSGGGNCGVPGNAPCETMAPVSRLFQPALGATVWTIFLGLFLFANRGERRVQRLCFLGAWYLSALALLAKGAPGLVLPLIVAVAILCATRRFRDFARLELPGLVLLIACVALPWYVQAYARHGAPFTDRLLFHDMYKRAFVHVHDTNVGDDVSFGYYLWQLGYGLFPWTGIAAAGLVTFAREGDEAEGRRAELAALLGLWTVLAFSMFAVSLTKFHHYALPVTPPLCLLTGILLDRALDAPATSPARTVAYFSGLLLTALCLVLGALRFGAGNLLGAVHEGAPFPDPAPGTGAALLLVGLALFAASVWLVSPARARDARLGPEQPTAETPTSASDIASLGLIGVAAAALLVLLGRDLTTDGAVEGDARLLHLFVYNYKRPFPDSLDFSATLRAFTAVAACACALFALPRLRAHGARLLCATAVLFAAFGANVYLVQTAPHWGQRETLITYYATRAGPEEPIVAFQMNWKGENFYTGNRIPAFVTTGRPFKDWVGTQREAGVRVVYFTTEHSRASILKHELGAVKSFSVLTKPTLNNKFLLARVEL